MGTILSKSTCVESIQQPLYFASLSCLANDVPFIYSLSLSSFCSQPSEGLPVWAGRSGLLCALLLVGFGQWEAPAVNQRMREEWGQGIYSRALACSSGCYTGSFLDVGMLQFSVTSTSLCPLIVGVVTALHSGQPEVLHYCFLVFVNLTHLLESSPFIKFSSSSRDAAHISPFLSGPEDQLAQHPCPQQILVTASTNDYSLGH